MKKVSLDIWLQTLGMLGVLGGLVFVGLEMQQSQRIAIAGQIQARNDALMSFLQTPLEGNTMLSKIINNYWDPTGITDLEPLTEEERQVALQMARVATYGLRNTFQQYNLGMIPEDTFEFTMQKFVGLYDTCYYRPMIVGNVSENIIEFLQSRSSVECD
jgi:hypothetical protein